MDISIGQLVFLGLVIIVAVFTRFDFIKEMVVGVWKMLKLTKNNLLTKKNDKDA